MALCIECEHVQKRKVWSYDSGGGHPSIRYYCINDRVGLLDHVTGEMDYKECWWARQNESRCGVEGRFHEERESVMDYRDDVGPSLFKRFKRWMI